MPRITRAQSMDALSSMATIAGYKAVLLAANTLPRMFPMMTTAAGHDQRRRGCSSSAPVSPACRRLRSARRLGAVVEAYDVRPAAKEQVQSVGAKVRRAAARGGRRRGQGRLREGAGRVVLPAPARDDGQGRGRERRRDHHGRRSRASNRPCWSRPTWSRHGAGLGDRRPCRRAWRQLRADAGRRGRHRTRRHHLRPDEPSVDRCRITPARCMRATWRRSSRI